MALSGTLDTFSLDEVLGLLAQTKKTGALVVTAPDTSGILFLAEGELCGAESDGRDDIPATASLEAVEAAILDLTFGLFRLRRGDFEFRANRSPRRPTIERIAIDTILAQVRAVLADWDAVEAVVPSPDAYPRLVAELAAERVTIERTAWRVLFAVNGSRTVREVAASLDCSVVGASRALKDLVNAGAVEFTAATPVVDLGSASSVGLDAVDRALPEPGDGVGDDGPNPAVDEAVDGVVDEAAGEEGEDLLVYAAPAETALDDDLATLPPIDDVPEAERIVIEGRPTAEDRAALANLSDLPEIPRISEFSELTDPPVDDDAAEEPAEREPATVRSGDRGALLRMFSSLRDS